MHTIARASSTVHPESSRYLNSEYWICCRCLDHRDCKRTLAIPRYLCRGQSVGAIWLRYVHWEVREPAPGAGRTPRAARVAIRPTHNQIHHKYGHFQRKFRGIDHAQTPFWTDTELGRARDVATSHVSNPHFYFWRPPPARRDAGGRQTPLDKTFTISIYTSTSRVRIWKTHDLVGLRVRQARAGRRGGGC